MTARVWLVLPTYNEAENLETMVPAALTALDRAAPADHRVLIVDDNSPDGTGQIADGLADQHQQVEVLHRPAKRGLGKAYVAGFTHAMQNGGELLVQMDADFSHDPSYLPALIAAAEQADLALGSRYVKGGGVQNWGLIRRLVSRGGGLYAQLVLGVHVSDLTGGFKAIHRQVLERIGLDHIRSDGYGFQIEVTYRALLAGFHVKEIPITFVDRTRGNSKMSLRIALEAFWLVPKMRKLEAPETPQLTKS
ncbi:MAG: polyprenol monophosphomannose synthase [Solirubrobacterales bacterium]|nr:polyprenol monophosphomannose synthase [Solirubrobacterales bacterium]